ARRGPGERREGSDLCARRRVRHRGELHQSLRRARRQAAHAAGRARPAPRHPARRVDRAGPRRGSRADSGRPRQRILHGQRATRPDRGEGESMSQEHLSQALRRIAASGTTAMTDRATALREAGRDVISLSVGEPDFATPRHVLDAAKEALDSGQTKYTPVTGTLQLKQAAALHFRRDLGIAAEPGNIIVCAGGKQAIFHALLATISPGEEVIVPAPWWVSYPQIIRFAGGRAVPLITHAKDNFRFTPA